MKKLEMKRCIKCDAERPDFFFPKKRSICSLCDRAQRNKNNRRLRRLRRDEERAAERQRYHNTAVPLRRCRNSYYQIRVRSPQNIPFWSTIDSVLPIYEYAHTLSLENPGFRYTVCHIVPMRGKEVCGLHTLENLRIVRTPSKVLGTPSKVLGSKIRRSPSAHKSSV